ncbi:unnamed protein product, partial [Brassica rapa subsp. narinosa]
TRVPAPVAPPLSIQSRSPSVSVDLLSSPIYFRIWARVFYRRKSSADGGFQTAVTYLSLDSCFRGVEASSALRRRQSLREVEALSALRRRFVLRGVKASFTLPRLAVEIRGCSLAGGRERCPYQDGDVL